MSLGEYLWAGSWTTKWLYHLNWDSADSSGNWNNGTDTAISYVAGKFGNCASFNGSSSFINYTTPITTATNNLTISLWVYISWTSLNWTFIHIWNNTGVPDNWYTLWVWNTTTWNVWNNLIWLCNWVAWMNFNIPIWTWREHVLMTRNSGTWYWYVNWKVSATTFTTTPNTPTNNTMIWRDIDITPSFFNWLIDEVIIENVARTAEQVKKYYTYTQWRFGIL